MYILNANVCVREKKRKAEKEEEKERERKGGREKRGRYKANALYF